MATIVILDDSPTNRSIYSRLATMVEDGVVAEVFADPLDALEWLQYNRADLVITDFKMPGMDGATFTRRLRSLPRMAQTPVLVVTAHDNRSYRLQALDAGATDFLQSPIDHFEFVTRARNLLALGRSLGAASDAPAEPAQEAGPVSAGSILDALPARISVTDPTGRYLFANAAFASALGRQVPELLGQTAPMLLGAERGTAAWNGDRQLFETGEAPPPSEEKRTDADGIRRRLLTTRHPLRDQAGKIVAVVTASIELPEEAGSPS
ncbi:response regulator [Belnapia sp. T6]|uniref:Response regulator n=1 Tax=Belnapia mucosa TaxID=2804532 RepID=A0ABS1V4S9_9PROT|nr:response regulator [Belnapia mucosa]MBL6456597.1 response regulator [Belnapia mucosa]